jgi:DNA-binding beta-propeller fold protein YncE
MTTTRPTSLATVSNPAYGGLHPARARALRPLVLAVLVAATTLASAAPGAGGRAEEKKKPAKAKSAAPAIDREPVWPLPPEPARIRYVTSYRGANDFDSKKKPSGWKTLVFGQDSAAPEVPDTLVKPYGVATGSDGRVYVSDTASRRVFVFDAERRTVTFLGDRQPAKLAKPTGIAVDASGTVFVADATHNRIFGFAPTGALAIAIGRDGDLESPAGMAIDADRQLLYVADSKKHQVFCYSTADGSAVRTIGRRGSEPGEFNFPTNVSVDKEGRLYVTDTLNFRIQSFDAEGRPLGAFGTLGDTPGSLNRPKGIGVDDEGHVYVADTSFNNFQIFDREGQLLLYVGSVGSGPGEFFLPAGLFVDQRNRVYVVDQGNARVQVFQYLRAPEK